MEDYNIIWTLCILQILVAVSMTMRGTQIEMKPLQLQKSKYVSVVVWQILGGIDCK